MLAEQYTMRAHHNQRRLSHESRFIIILIAVPKLVMQKRYAIAYLFCMTHISGAPMSPPAPVFHFVQNCPIGYL